MFSNALLLNFIEAEIECGARVSPSYRPAHEHVSACNSDYVMQ